MGSCCSDPDQENIMETMLEINETAKKQKRHKMLLLGTGSNGKSTLFKQIADIYNKSVDQDETWHSLEQPVSMNRFNCVQGILLLISKADELSSQFPALKLPNDEKTTEYIDMLKSFKDEKFDNTEKWNERPFTYNYVPHHKPWEKLKESLNYLWSLPQIKAVYAKQEHFSIEGNLAYFLDKVDQLFDGNNYSPTQQDVIEADIRTTGITDLTVTINDHLFRFWDTGGQRNERNKWIHCFNDVDGVIYIAALDHYATVLYEAETTNAMHESLVCFGEVCNGKWFKKSQMILLFTRTDLFKQRLFDGVALTHCFEDYEGPNWNGSDLEFKEAMMDKQFNECYDSALLFIQEMYNGMNDNKDKTIFVHVVDTNNREAVEKVVSDIQHIMINCTPRIPLL